MANVKITDLTAYTDAASTDVLPVVDVTNDVTKKISIANLLKAAPQGSAAAPGIAFDGDPNTGVYSPGADQVAISTGGSGRLFVDASGNIGINTSPSSLGSSVTTLEIKGGSTTRSGGLRVSSSDSSVKGAFYIYDGAGVLGTESATPLDLYTGNSPRLRITSAGLVGIGTTPSTELHVSRATAGRVITRLADPDGRTTELRSPDNVGNTAGVGTATNHPFVFFQNNTEAARVDESKRLLVGTSTSRGNYYNSSGLDHLMQVESTGFTMQSWTTHSAANSAAGSYLALARSRGSSVGSVTLVQSGDSVGRLNFQGADGSQFVEAAAIECLIDGTPGADDMPGRLVFSTTADGASSPTERMRISQSGNLSVGVASDSGFHELRKSGGSETSAIVGFSTSGSNYPVAIYQVTGAGANGAAAAMLVGRGSVTSRSINAGGTVNASGADYAEYMIKAGNFTIAKGAVCGVTADGQLTNEFADAVSFVVKSTNPAYVGGDTWGSEDVVGAKPEADDADALVQWEADLEAARQAVDRIAFAGQVPVNVMGATPGQYIVPVEAADGGIEGVAKNEADMTLAEYMRAVGKVIAIEDDGRARIIVKVA